jgi:hypothetical protein
MMRGWMWRACALLCACAVAASVAGCDEIVDQLVPKDDETAQAALTSLNLSAIESALLAVSVEDADKTQTNAQIAEAAAARVTAQLTPSGCVVTNTTIPGTLALDLTDCSGPYGLANVSGKAAIVFSIDKDEVLASLTATGLKANDNTLTINANGVITRDGDSRMLALTTNGGGVGADQRLISRNGSYTFSWDVTTRCFTLIGTWGTTVTSASTDTTDTSIWTTTVKDYGRCPGQCPTDKGSITYAGTSSDADGAVLTISFDGTDKAIYASSRGAGGSLPITCQ